MTKGAMARVGRTPRSRPRKWALFGRPAPPARDAEVAGPKAAASLTVTSDATFDRLRAGGDLDRPVLRHYRLGLDKLGLGREVGDASGRRRQGGQRLRV